MSLLNKALVVDHFKITLSAGATNVCTITITAQDRNNKTIKRKIPFHFWASEDSGGMGLTADAYSGALAATIGAILTALTAKKEVTAVTAATGIAVLTITDTVKPADQYFCVENPDGSIAVSAASGTNWG